MAKFSLLSMHLLLVLEALCGVLSYDPGNTNITGQEQPNNPKLLSLLKNSKNSGKITNKVNETNNKRQRKSMLPIYPIELELPVGGNMSINFTYSTMHLVPGIVVWEHKNGTHNKKIDVILQENEYKGMIVMVYKLKIYGVTKEDEGQYWCTFQSYDKKIFNKRVAILKVKDENQDNSYKSDRRQTSLLYTSHIAVNEYTELTLSCKGNGLPEEPVWMYTHSDRNITRNLLDDSCNCRPSGTDLIFEDLNFDANMGFYACNFQDSQELAYIFLYPMKRED